MVRAAYSVLLATAIAASALPASAAYGAKKSKTPPATAAPTNTLATTIAGDQKDIADDQTALAKASKDLNDATNKLVADNDQTPDVVAAKKSITDAAAAQQAAREKAMAVLAKDPTYKAAVAKESAAKDDLSKLRGADTPDQDAISDKSTEAFNDGAAVSKLERAALDLDPAFTAADKKLSDANAALAAIHAKLKDSLKTDPSLAALRTARDDAQTKLATDQAKLDTDRKGGTATASGK